MPLFSTDTDILAYEPAAFTELPFTGQTKLKVTDATLSGSTITSTAGGFTRLARYDVALLGDAGFSIANIVNNNSLTLASIPVGVTGGAMIVRTFVPQATLVHDELMRAMGIDRDDPDNKLTESAVLTTTVVRRLEVLGTLARAYAAAITVTNTVKAIQDKADRYRKAFRRELLCAAVLLDTNADGHADLARFPGAGEMVRV